MIHSESTADGWAAQMVASPYATVFSDPRYVEAMARVGNLVVVEHPGRALLCRKGGGHVVLPPFTPLSGIVLPELSESDVHAGSDPLSAWAVELERAFRSVRLHLPPSLKDPRPLQWRGWRVSPLYTYVLDPGAGTEPWSESARRTARKDADAFGIRAASAADLPEVLALVREGYARSKRPAPADMAATRKAAASMMEAGMADCRVAVKHGKIAAGVVLLHDRHTSYYWLAGSVPGPAMTVLLAGVLEEVAGRGSFRLDMMGANTASIAEFKRRLGGSLCQYWAATYDRGLIARSKRAMRVLLGK